MTEQTRFIHNYRNFDPLAFTADVANMDWNDIYAEKTVDGAVALFNFMFMQLLKKHMPLKRIRSRIMQAPWVMSEFVSFIDRKEYQSKLFKNCPCPFHLNLKKESIKTCNKMKVALKRYYIRHTLEKYKTDPKRLWRSIREFWPNSKKANKKISKIVQYSDDQSIADALNNHFADVASNITANIPDVSDTDLPESVIHPPVFEFEEITPMDISNAIARLGPSKACADDGITSYMVKCCKCEILPVLTYLFHLSLKTKTFPTLWKSLDTLQTHVDLLNNVYGEIDKGGACGILFVDLAKAFNTVDHALLIHKLRNLGFRPSACSWFTSYLNDRCQCTRVGSVLSGLR